MTGAARDPAGTWQAAAEAASGRRRMFLLAVGLFSLWLVLGTLFGRRGVLELQRYRQEHARLQVEIKELEAAVTRLQHEVEALQSDPAAIERLAREELSLVRPGEVLVFIDPPPPAAVLAADDGAR